MDFLQTLIGCIFGSGMIGLVEFLIRRKDEKADKTSEILKAITNLKEAVDGIEERFDLENADDARRNILAFDDELRRGLDHSEESYNQILDDVNYYTRYCKKHIEYENNKASNAIKHINDCYQRVKAENKFI